MYTTMLALVLVAVWSHINLTAYRFRSLTINQLSSCQQLCSNEPGCDGSMERTTNATRQCLLFGRGQRYPKTVTNSDIQNFSGYIKRTCPFALDTTTVCYPTSKICVLCPNHETTYQRFAGKNFEIIVSHDCCTRPGTSGEITWNSTHNVEISGLRFTTLPNDTTKIISQCPILSVKSDASQISVENLEINCSTQNASITITKIGKMEVRVTDLKTSGAVAAVVIAGVPTENQQSGAIDLSDSYFSNITTTGRYPNAAVALANHVGNPIGFGTFSQTIVLQPMLSDNDKAPVYNPSPPIEHVIDISAYTDVYGADYAVEFEYRGAFEPSYENKGLRDLLGAQVATFLTLLFFIVMFNQDIIYGVLTGAYKGGTRRMEKTK